MSENYAPYKRKADHAFIHEFTSKMNKIKKEMEELHELTEAYIQSNLQRKVEKSLDGMVGYNV